MNNIEKAKRILTSQSSIQHDIFGNPVEKVKVKDTIGFFPISIWKVDWKVTKILKEYVGDIGAMREGCSTLAYKKYCGCKTNVSIFNPYLTKLILNAYAKKGCKIYDPFAGGGTRAVIAAAMGYEYTGVEIREEEVDSILKRKDELGLDFTIHLNDATKFVQPNEFDFSFTCPPYYNLETYNGGESDLSMAETYDDFLVMMKKAMINVYKSLKPDSFSIWVVGNFRHKNGKLIHFSGDLVRIGEEVGFDLYDEVILHTSSDAAYRRIHNFATSKKIIRVHQNMIVFRKVK